MLCRNSIFISGFFLSLNWLWLIICENAIHRCGMTSWQGLLRNGQTNVQMWITRETSRDKIQHFSMIRIHREKLVSISKFYLPLEQIILMAKYSCILALSHFSLLRIWLHQLSNFFNYNSLTNPFSHQLFFTENNKYSVFLICKYLNSC